MKFIRLRRRKDEELDAEILSHLDAAVRDRIERGETPEQARANALREFGNIGLVKEVTREMWALAWLERLGQDLRFGLRMLAKNPGFSVVAILTLALGVGANTAIFSVVNAVWLRSLPFKEPDKLVALWERNATKPDSDKNNVGSANFTDWRRTNQSFEALAAYSNWNYNLTGDGEPLRLRAVIATGDFFPALGTPAMLGRTFAAEDDRDGRDNVIVLSHAFWLRRFGGDREIIGRTVTLNNVAHTIIGVAPPGFEYPDALTEIWRPLAMSVEQQQNRQGKWLRAIGRLKAGVSRDQAATEMRTIAARLERQYPEANGGWGVTLTPLHEEIAGDARTLMWILLGAVGFVLLIACANVANLLLARATVRQKEIAVRAALGATRMRLLRQLLAESLLLSLFGSTAGLLLARWGCETLLALDPGNIPRLHETALDGRVLAFTLLLTAATTLLFGLLPALQASKVDLNITLKEEGSSAMGPAGRHWRNALVVAEIAVGVTLLVGAGLLLRSFLKLQDVDAGFDPRNLLTMQITLPARKYARHEQQLAFFHQAIEKIKALPGVQSVGAVQDLPLRMNTNSFPVDIVGRPTLTENERPMAGYRAISDDYLRTMGVPLLQGRAFTPQDNLTAPPVVLINQTMARRLWPGEDPLGKQIRFGEPDDPSYTIVGVVGDVKHMGLAREEGAVIYQPYAQKRFQWLRWMAVVVRTGGDPLILGGAIRNRVQEVDRDQPVYDIATMEQLLSNSVAEPRFTTLLFSGFALLALFLAALGVYSVASFAAAQRTHEIGLRVALGARPRDVLSLMIRQGMTLSALGAALGIAIAFGLTRLLGDLLFGVAATDPLTFAFAPSLLLGVALLACWLPARRAAKVDPLIALRRQ